MSNLRKLGKLLVLELLNRDNEEHFTFDDVVFHEPAALITPEGIRNTSLLVERKIGSEYRNSKEIKYWRVDLEKVILPEFRTMSGRGITNSSELVTLINDLYDLALDQDDVVFEDINAFMLPFEYTLKTNPLSYAYIGNVNLVLSNDLVPLRTVVRQTILADYITRELLQGIASPIVGAEDGTFPNVPNVPTDNFYITENGDTQLAVGVVVGNRIGIGSDVRMPTHLSTVGIALGLDTNWAIIMSTAVLKNGRLPQGSSVVAASKVCVQVTAQATGKMHEWNLGYHQDVGLYEWRTDAWFNLSEGPVPEVLYFNTDGVCHSYLDLFTLITSSDIVRTEWALVGKFDVVITIKPVADLISPQYVHKFSVDAIPV